MDRKIVTTNRKAYHDFTILEKFVAGIVLTGTEIKSIRKNAINLKDSFCKIEDNEIFLYKCHISPYEQGNRFNHDAERTRKLLMTKKEILKIQTKVKQDSITIVPLEVFLRVIFEIITPTRTFCPSLYLSSVMSELGTHCAVSNFLRNLSRG